MLDTRDQNFMKQQILICFLREVKFKNAYSAHPRCVPSRFAIMTGKYPARTKSPGQDLETRGVHNSKHYKMLDIKLNFRKMASFKR